MSKTVEQIYQKKTQHEHVLTRPDMYIGSIEPITDDIWVYDEAEHIMKQHKATWTPGLYKIFDEILVNAADNKVRDPRGQTMIKVWIEPKKVRVYNNGEGIPVQKHKEHDLWIPEMIFGHLLTSSNYNDDEAKVTGGRNGFGAKLTNVFSRRFEVETVHSKSRKKFHMKWTDNMKKHEEPNITPCDSSDYTQVTFYPDFNRFHMTEFTEDMMLLMKRRVYDIAGCTDKSMRCYLNGEKIAISSFQEYVDLYPSMGEERHKASYSKVNPRWELCVRVSNLGFQQVSFVNSINTSRGGTHVKYILDQIVNRVTEAARKKSKTEVKPHMIRPHIFLFINCLIENPGFDSQTKETLTTVRTKFGSSCDIPNSMIDYILRSGIVERSVEMANSKLTKEIASKLKTSDRKQIMGIPKLDDANEAGGKNSYRCTLILTEGDSAKTLCTAGLAVKDRDFFGVFPLRGKPLNVRDASLKKVMDCEEIQSVMKIMGLDIRQKYDSVDGLRYGHLMIMSDQDHDGSHIKGLIINMIQFYWPGLLKVPGFLQQFITPIVKAWRKGRRKDERAISFFSMPDYFEWKQSMGDSLNSYEIRYYKGLGTSDAKEGREYFENIDRHRLDFEQRSAEDVDRIVMAFAKDRVDDRKEWITQFKTNVNVNASIDYSVRKVSYKDFIDKELILFSVADCERSIPSVIDGFKPGQRKILFSSFKRNLMKSIKVVQLAGYVSEHSAYHHGDASLVQTIVAMAQDFVGSNNVPLLQQDGQFGTRLQGGKDHAAGRYIFTRLAQLTRFLFHPADDYVVEYKDDDGLSVEPFYYMPVIPMVLINGTSGIGTGFSTNIPNYSPVDLVDNLLRLINGQEVLPMRPWYFGFSGVIEEKEKGKFVSHGKYDIRPDGVVSITELPVNVWTQSYKKFLEDLREKEVVVQYREHNTDVTVDFEVFVHPQILQQWIAQDCVEEKLQLREFIHATNIIAFDREGQITKYLDAEAVLKEFYLIRLEFYARRKDYLLGELRRVTSKLENMARFVREVVSGELIIQRRKKKELLEELRRRKYTPMPPHSNKKVSATTVDVNEDNSSNTQHHSNSENAEDMLLLSGGGAADMIELNEEETPELQRASREYDYLLGMKLWSLTAEMIARLEAQLKRAKEDTASMEKRTPKDLWTADLLEVRPRLINYFAAREKEIASVQRRKMEKKRPFDARRLRVPILSDKARHALEKEMDKMRNTRATANNTLNTPTSSVANSSFNVNNYNNNNNNNPLSSLNGPNGENSMSMASNSISSTMNLDNSNSNVNGGAATRPETRRRRRRRKRDSDDDDDDDNDDDQEGGEVLLNEHSSSVNGKPTRRTRQVHGNGPEDAGAENTHDATQLPRRRAKKEKLEDFFSKQKTGATGVTTTNSINSNNNNATDKYNNSIVKRDEFDLDFFGLDALNLPAPSITGSSTIATTSTTTTRAASVKPLSSVLPTSSLPFASSSSTSKTAASSATHHLQQSEDIDELQLLGISKPSSNNITTNTNNTTNNNNNNNKSSKPMRGTSKSRSRSTSEPTRIRRSASPTHSPSPTRSSLSSASASSTKQKKRSISRSNTPTQRRVTTSSGSTRSPSPRERSNRRSTLATRSNSASRITRSTGETKRVVSANNKRKSSTERKPRENKATSSTKKNGVARTRRRKGSISSDDDDDDESDVSSSSYSSYSSASSSSYSDDSDSTYQSSRASRDGKNNNNNNNNNKDDNDDDVHSSASWLDFSDEDKIIE